MKRYYYSDSILNFIRSSTEEILGALSLENEFALETNQRKAWLEQIKILKNVLNNYSGRIFFEYSIPRMGRRIDVILIIRNAIFILEFKIGGTEFLSSALDQVWDYALDLKNFHKTSHISLIAPILIVPEIESFPINISLTQHNDNVLFPTKANKDSLREIISSVLEFADGEIIDPDEWKEGGYSPTPNIIEAAMALYSGHSVSEISRSDASAINLSETSEAISDIIIKSKNNNRKSICFVTGVPGAGKTLVGLNIATKRINKDESLTSVFLSGNGPLVAILREALTIDTVRREKEKGIKIKKGTTLSKVKVFIQNVHHFRDEGLIEPQKAPYDHVAIFDEAQRAWNHTQTAKFMREKKKQPNFIYSEPEFLISCLDRHNDWAVVICLVGGGQEINTGEAGISEWLGSIKRSFPEWDVYISPNLTDSEYSAGNALSELKQHKNVILKEELHLSVSLRSFRSEHISLLVKNILDLNIEEAKKNYTLVKDKYPIIITRDLSKAKKWLKDIARGTERYGIIVSSQAMRLKPHAIDVKSPMDPVHWFLDSKEDIRSSFYLEDVATEFDVQRLELDWSCVTWDADFKYSPNGWQSFSFVGSRWNNINKDERKQYLKNAYRVLLTRARQGMVIVVPPGEKNDPTRLPEFYDSTFKYLSEVGFKTI